jgi:branched-chain amino acid transport system permease protein
VVVVIALALGAYGLQRAEVIGPYWLNVLCNMGINILLAVSLNLVNGFTGQFSIGHAGFLAIGAYVAGWITYYGGLLIWNEVPVTPPEGWFPPQVWLFAAGCVGGGLVAGLFGWLVGLPSLRLRGDYLAIVTLGFGEIVRVLLQQTGPVLADAAAVKDAGLSSAMALGGSLGFVSVDTGLGLTAFNNLFWTVFFLGATILICYRLKQSSTGRAFLSVREDEIAAQAMGINLTRIKVRAFVIGAVLAGIGGGLFAHQSGNNLTPTDANFVRSFDILIPVVLGGLGSISGVVLAAALLTMLPEILRNPGEYLPLWPWLGAVAAIGIGVGLAIRHRRAMREVCFAVAILALAPVMLALAGWACKKPGWITQKGFELGEYRMILFALLLVLMMILRPQGLFGVHEVWEARKLFKFKKPGGGRA